MQNGKIDRNLEKVSDFKLVSWFNSIIIANDIQSLPSAVNLESRNATKKEIEEGINLGQSNVQVRGVGRKRK